MKSINDAQGSRLVAQTIAVLLGFCGGLVLLVIGFWSGLIFITANDNWLSLSGAAAGTLTLLPLSLMALWKPRLAAYAILASSVYCLVCAAVFFRSAGTSVGFVGWLRFTLLFVLPQGSIAGLLLYGSNADRPPRPRLGSF